MGHYIYEIDRLKDKEGNLKESNKRVIKFTKDNYGIGNILEGYSFEWEIFPLKIRHQEISYNADEFSLGIPNDF